MQNQKRVLFEQMILDELNEQEYRAKKTVLDGELTRLQEVQITLSTKLSQRQGNEQTKSANRKLAQKVVDTGQLSIELADALIDRVYVYPNNQVEIVWKTKDFCKEAV